MKNKEYFDKLSIREEKDYLDGGFKEDHIPKVLVLYDSEKDQAFVVSYKHCKYKEVKNQTNPKEVPWVDFDE